MRTPGLPSLDGESAWKQLTDPSEHLFKLNVKTGATEWYAEQAQNHGAAAPQSAGGVAVMPAITANAGAKQPETKPQAKKGEASETNWFAAHGWLDDWLGWGETVADPASQEVRDDVARDLGIRTQPPSEVVAVEARNTEKVVPQAHAANASPSSMEKPPSEMRTALAQQASQGLDERTSAAETEAPDLPSLCSLFFWVVLASCSHLHLTSAAGAACQYRSQARRGAGNGKHHCAFCIACAPRSWCYQEAILNSEVCLQGVRKFCSRMLMLLSCMALQQQTLSNAERLSLTSRGPTGNSAKEELMLEEVSRVLHVLEDSQDSATKRHSNLFGLELAHPIHLVEIDQRWLRVTMNNYDQFIQAALCCKLGLSVCVCVCVCVFAGKACEPSLSEECEMQSA